MAKSKKPPTPPAAKGEAPPPRIAVRYERAPACRVIHVDGAWGGPTPHGNIQMAVYSEAGSLPEHQELVVDQDGKARPVPHERPKSFTRQIEAELVFSPATAAALVEWLVRHLATLSRDQPSVESANEEERDVPSDN